MDGDGAVREVSRTRRLATFAAGLGGACLLLAALVVMVLRARGLPFARSVEVASGTFGYVLLAVGLLVLAVLAVEEVTIRMLAPGQDGRAYGRSLTPLGRHVAWLEGRRLVAEREGESIVYAIDAPERAPGPLFADGTVVRAAAALGPETAQAARIARAGLAAAGVTDVAVEGGVLRARQRATAASTQLASVEATASALAWFLRLAPPAPVAGAPPLRLARSEAPSTAPLRCPFCLDTLDRDEPATPCPACGTAVHAACGDEAGRCTVLGCEGALPSTARATPGPVRAR